MDQLTQDEHAQVAKIIRSLIGMGVTESKLYKSFMTKEDTKLIDFNYFDVWYTIVLEHDKYKINLLSAPLSTKIHITDLDNVSETIDKIDNILNITQ